MRIVGYAADEALLDALAAAAGELGAKLTLLRAQESSTARDDQLFAALRTHPEVAVVESRADLLERVRAETLARSTCLLLACTTQAEVNAAVRAGVDEWVLLPAEKRELAARVPLSAFVSSDGLTSKPDNLHFDARSQREFGKRYAAALASIQLPVAAKH